MAIKIGIHNRKGGVAKTISTINIGAILALQGKRVLLIDGDSQQSMSQFFFGENAEFFDGPSLKESVSNLYDVLTENYEIQNCIYNLKYTVKRKINNKFKNLVCSLDIIPGSKQMDEIEFSGLEMLKEKLFLIEHEYDYILIDCPPAFSDAIIVYMTACDFIAVPAQLGTPDSIYGYFDVLENIDNIINSGANEDLKVLGLFYTMVMDYKKDQKSSYEESVKEKDGLNLFEHYVRHDYAPCRLSQKTHQPLCICSPRSNAAADYEALVNEMKKRIKKYERN